MLLMAELGGRHYQDPKAEGSMGLVSDSPIWAEQEKRVDRTTCELELASQNTERNSSN